MIEPSREATEVLLRINTISEIIIVRKPKDANINV